MVFPEGTSTQDGKPQQFNPGIFKLCAEYNIPIIPIMLVYDKNIGLNKEDNINYRDWMNNTITTIIHP